MGFYIANYLTTGAAPYITGSETPVGTVNGINKTFTVSNTPKYVVSDGVTYFANNGYTIVGLTITMDYAPTGFIRSYY